jgi:hypothetical protein
MPAIHSKPKLLTPHTVEFWFEGELVVMKVGNSELRLHYEDALNVSQRMRVTAKQAKHATGDVSRHWSAIGTLEGIVE